MTTTLTEEIVILDDGVDSEELTHLTHCTEPHGDHCPGCVTALCGEDLSGHNWVNPGKSRMCAMCVLEWEREE